MIVPDRCGAFRYHAVTGNRRPWRPAGSPWNGYLASLIVWVDAWRAERWRRMSLWGDGRCAGPEVGLPAARPGIRGGYRQDNADHIDTCCENMLQQMHIAYLDPLGRLIGGSPDRNRGFGEFGQRRLDHPHVPSLD